MHMRISLVLAAIATASAALLPATAAHAVPPEHPGVRAGVGHGTGGLDPATRATMRRQEALQPALSALWEEYLNEPGSGWAGVAYEDNGLTLYWKGALTSGMAAAVAKAGRVGPVRVKAARYSEAELRAEGQKIHQKIKELGFPDIQTIGYKPDGSGLIVSRDPAGKMANLRWARAKAGKPAPVPAEKILAAARLSVPVELTTADSDLELTADRYHDNAPWNGGDSFITRRNGNFRDKCTTGFGVHSSNGISFVLTASHCASAADQTYQGDIGSTAFMGNVNQDNYWMYDIVLINASGWHIIFDGPSNTSTTKNVHGWGGWMANELVCQSGAVSGTVCGIKQQYSTDFVVPQSSPDSDGDWGYTIYGLIQCTQVDGITAAVQGDSGGPVFTLDGDGVLAKGTTSAGGGTSFLFQDWATIIQQFNVRPNTFSSTL
jgi:hypothetical protein